MYRKIGSSKSHKNWSARQWKIFTNPQISSELTSPIMLELVQVFEYDGYWSDVGWVNIFEERQLYSSYEWMIIWDALTGA